MSAPVVIALVGEDGAHAVLLAALTRTSIARGALAAGREWIVDNLVHDPAFHGQEDLGDVLPGLRYTSSIRFDPNSIRIDGKPLRLRGLRGLVDGRPQEPEAHRWRQVLTGILASEPSPEIVLVARDTDGAPEKIAGLRQVVQYLESRNPDRVIIFAAPHQDAECWFVAGFEPQSPREAEALAQVVRELAFDPRLHPERLTAHPNDARTDAKRVLRRLMLLDVASAPLAPDELRDTHDRLLGDLGRLRQRGLATGLVDFLDDLHRRVVPRFVPGA